MLMKFVNSNLKKHISVYKYLRGIYQSINIYVARLTHGLWRAEPFPRLWASLRAMDTDVSVIYFSQTWGSSFSQVLSELV